MKHLAVIRIKNTDFDYSKYGLKNNFFSIDVSNSVSYSKGIGFTQYALLDGTTRVDNTSREPATVNLQGLLGEVRGGGSPENFVYATAEKNRLQNQMDLIEALRDQAIFLDVITDERTYRDYLIKSVSFGKTRFGQIDAQLSLQEVITFGDEISVETSRNRGDMSNYEQDLILDSFFMNPVNSDAELVDEINRIITASSLSTPFIIQFGTTEDNTDVIMPSYRITKQIPSYTSTLQTRTEGTSVIVSDSNVASIKTEGVELVSGVVAGNYYLHMTLPTVEKGSNIYNTRLTKNPSGAITATNIPKTTVHVRLMQNNYQVYAVQNNTVIMTPQYSDMINGIHYLSVSGSNADVISASKFAKCFIRKQKNKTYSFLPNILGSTNRGYLYRSTFEQATGKDSVIYPGTVYIHPKAWERIVSEIQRVWKESPYFKDKELILV